LLAKGRLERAAGRAVVSHAVEIARRQKARSWELRETTSLARLLRDANRQDEARAALTEIYGLFTEGFDPADLKDASALLDELRGQGYTE
jgi:predicted ATPase